MPFTFSHPAVVLPLRRWCPHQLAFSGLIVGSMVPDSGYYLHLWSLSAFAHTAYGIALVVPLGWIAVLVIYSVRQALSQILPFPLCEFTRGLELPQNRRISTVLSVSICIALGVLTHIIWDSFTHSAAWSVNQIPALSAPALQISGVTVHTYQILQYASSIVGLVVVAWYCHAFAKPLKSTLSAAEQKSRCVRLLALSVAAVLLGISVTLPQISLGLSKLLFLCLVNTIAAASALLILLAFIHARKTSASLR